MSLCAQEFNAAKEAVLSVLPDAAIRMDRTNDYPIAVSVRDDKTNQELWAASQKKLFRKYAKDRTASQTQIADACTKAYLK